MRVNRPLVDFLVVEIAPPVAPLRNAGTNEFKNPASLVSFKDVESGAHLKRGRVWCNGLVLVDASDDELVEKSLLIDANIPPRQ